MEWLGYTSVQMCFTIVKRNIYQNHDFAYRSYLLHQNVSPFYFIQAKHIYQCGSLTLEPTINYIRTCCCSGFIINGEFNTHEFNSEYHKPSRQNIIDPDICRYRSITFCSECLMAIERKCIRKCFDGRCRNKPGVMQCLPYVFDLSRRYKLTQPVVIYSDPMEICDNCASKMLCPNV